MKSMNGLAIMHKGLEPFASQEIEGLIKTKTICEETVVRFPIKEIRDLCLVCYKIQSAAKLVFLLGHTQFSTFENILSCVKQLDFSDFLVKEKTFRVRSTRIGDHAFDSADIEQEIGDYLGEKYGCNVNLNDPDIPVYIYTYHNVCYIGIDFSGFDLSKRAYRIFAPAEQLRATTAYAMLRIAEFSPKTALLDPFCGSGTLLIEAALYACNYSINYYQKDKFAFLRFPNISIDPDVFFKKIDDEIQSPITNIQGFDKLLPHVKAAQKNAKIAGINKQIHISKIEVDWLDVKLDKNSFDLIATNPPIMTKLNEKSISKAYKELFYQADFILKKDGKVVLVTPIPETFKPFAHEYKFKETKRVEVDQGKQKLYVLRFEK